MSSLQPLFSGPQYQQIKERDDALAELARCREGVTVCVPCFEDHAFLARALASVRAQTVQPARFIVIDDGSSIEASEQIEAISLEHGADYVWVTNRGLASARNTALMLTNTLAFLPLDADDWIDKQYIEKTLPLLQDADVVLTGIEEHGPSRHGTYMPGFDRPYDQVSADLILGDYNRFYYCNSAEAPVWMGDLGFRPLGDIVVGDSVIGWEETAGRPQLCVTPVLAVNHRNAPLIRVVLESGRELRCTAEHLWHSPQMYSPDRKPVNGRGHGYVHAEPGRWLASVVEPSSYAFQGEKLRLAGWLGGMYDGEGTGANIMQSPSANPSVCVALREALIALEIPFVENGNIGGSCIAFRIIGGKQAVVDFIAKTQPVRRDPLRKVVLKTKFRTADRVASIHPDGEGEVVSLQTGTGNYTAWGYASKNCSLVRTQLLREVGGYNAKMNRGLEDADLWVDLLRRGARFAAVQEALLHYSTENPNSMLMTIHRDGGYDEMVAEMRQHHASTTNRSYLARARAVSPEIS